MWHRKEFDPVVPALWPDGYIARQAQSSLIQAPQKEPLFHHQRLLQFRFAPDKDVRFGGHFFLSLTQLDIAVFVQKTWQNILHNHTALLFQFCKLFFEAMIPKKYLYVVTFTYDVGFYKDRRRNCHKAITLCFFGEAASRGGILERMAKCYDNFLL